jgi:membrane associated rhomboid family serine protease
MVLATALASRWEVVFGCSVSALSACFGLYVAWVALSGRATDAVLRRVARRSPDLSRTRVWAFCVGLCWFTMSGLGFVCYVVDGFPIWAPGVALAGCLLSVRGVARSLRACYSSRA